MVEKSDVIRMMEGGPVAYWADIAKMVGSVTAGVFLSQLLYWSGKGHDEDGWIYKTQRELFHETGLSRWEQQTARERLKALKILEEKKCGMPAKLYYRINHKVLMELIEGYYQNRYSDIKIPQTRMWESHKQGCGNPTNKDVGIPQTTPYYNTKNTTENTSNINLSVVSQYPNTTLREGKKLQRNKPPKEVCGGADAQPPIQKVNDETLCMAEELAKIILTKKKVRILPSQIQSWAREMKRLIDRHKIEPGRIWNALNWYRDNIGGEFVPVIESGRSFREKFLRLEAAMERSEKQGSTSVSSYIRPKPSNAAGYTGNYKDVEVIEINNDG